MLETLGIWLFWIVFVIWAVYAGLCICGVLLLLAGYPKDVPSGPTERVKLEYKKGYRIG